MKIIVFFFFTLVAVGSAEDKQNFRQFNSNSIIRQLFEMLRYFVKNGYPEKDVNASDPTFFKYSKIKLYSPGNILSLHAGFADAVVSGFSDYQLVRTEFKKEEVATDLYIYFPTIVFKSEHYEMEGNIYNSIPITGNGRFEFKIHNFSFSGKTFLRQSEDQKSILIANITNPSFSVGQIESQIEFDGNIDDIVNAIITDHLAGYLTRFNRFIASRYIDAVIEKINPFLYNFESWRILATLL